jgi:hypothetical protein
MCLNFCFLPPTRYGFSMISKEPYSNRFEKWRISYIQRYFLIDCDVSFEQKKGHISDAFIILLIYIYVKKLFDTFTLT